jgi:hypothetical protein
MPPAVAASRLAYHVGRNWKPNSPERRRAREWIDRVAAELDRTETTAHLDAIYLPTILRYAMLATRGAERGEV